MAQLIVDSELEQLAVNTIRFLAVDAVEKAKSGHPGTPSGMADYAFVLWTKYLKYNPADPAWPNRDRFVLSAGHASMLLYALLHLAGFDMPMEQIKNFRQWGSITPGHPESELAPGVEVTTGPLGQGFANGVGMAIGANMMAARFNRPGYDIIDHNVFAIASDGDLMEGVSHEAASLAGHLGLDNLIYIYDDNHISIEGDTELAYSDDVEQRFEGYGWYVQRINGHDRAAADRAISNALREDRRPSLIAARTHIGYGAPHRQDTKEAHGEPLGPDEAAAMKQNLGWPLEPAFYVPEEVYRLFDERRRQLVEEYNDWHAMFDRYRRDYPEEARLWDDMMALKVPEDITDRLLTVVDTTKEAATRDSSGQIMQEIAKMVPSFCGGAADLAPSTKTHLEDYGDIEKGSFDGRNFHFGVREHAMGGICTGLALYGGFIPFAATFLIFSDYMRPTLRLASMQRAGVIYVFTHDSVFLGEDGPTHEPIEHLASIRAIPGMNIIRSADASETAVAWAAALKNRHGPTALALTRQKVPLIERQDPESVRDLEKGAYIISDPAEGGIDVILMATGSELHVAVEAAKMLAEQGVGGRVVSFPSHAFFERQPREYKEKILPPSIPNRVTIEAAASMSWYRYAGTYGLVIGLDRFGASAPYKVIAEQLGFTPDKVARRVLDYLYERKKNPTRATIEGAPECP
ncbi:MAG: transketolase [Armatimonadetes bacterium]|nr:transketolase [Armatimonadota bacterium]